MPHVRQRNEGQTCGRGLRALRLPAPSGMVIIELIGVIAVMSMLLAVVVTLFAAVYRIERSWSEAAAEGRELNRLGAYFREDAHQAGDVLIAEGSGSWSFLVADGRRVDYEVLTGGVRRTVWPAGDQGAEFAKRQELSVPAAAKIKVQDRPFAGERLVTLTVAAEAASGGGSHLAALLSMEAQLGRFHSQPSEESIPAR